MMLFIVLFNALVLENNRVNVFSRMRIHARHSYYLANKNIRFQIKYLNISIFANTKKTNANKALVLKFFFC